MVKGGGDLIQILILILILEGSRAGLFGSLDLRRGTPRPELPLYTPEGGRRRGQITILKIPQETLIRLRRRRVLPLKR